MTKSAKQHLELTTKLLSPNKHVRGVGFIHMLHSAFYCMLLVSNRDEYTVETWGKVKWIVFILMLQLFILQIGDNTTIKMT